MRRALAIVAVGVAALVVAAMLVVRTPWFEGWLAGQVAAIVNRGVAGRVEIDSLRPGLHALELQGVRAFAPDGARVLDVEAARLEWERLPLRDWNFTSLRVEGVAVDVDVGAAFEPRLPSSSPGGGFSLAIDDLVIDRADLVKGSERLAAGVATRLRVRITDDGMTAKGGASGSVPGWSVPIELDLDAAFADGWRALSVDALHARSGGSTASVAGKADLSTFAVELRDLDLRMAVGELALLAPGLARLDGLHARGGATLEAGVARAKLEVEQGANRASLEGELALLGLGWKVTARTDHVDPSSLDGDLPAAALGGTIRISGAGSEVEDARLDGVQIRLGNARAGPIDALVEKHPDGWRVERFAASFPGATVRASGRVGTEKASLAYHLEVARIERAASALDAWCDAFGVDRVGVEGVTGTFTADGRLEGWIDAPTVVARIRSPRLARGDLVATDVDVSGRISGLDRHPVALVAGTIGALGDVEAIRLDLELRGGRARGRVEGRSAIGPLRANLDAAVAQDLAWVRFESLAFEWPGATWTLRDEATIRLSGGVKADARFVGPHGGELAASVSSGRGGWAVEATGEGIDVASLPAFLELERFGLSGRASFSASLSAAGLRVDGAVEDLEVASLPGMAGHLGGRATVRAHGEGSWSAPSVTASVEIPALEVEGVDGFGLGARATWAEGGATADLALTRSDRELARGALRIDGGDLSRWRELPLHGDLRAAELDLDRLAPLVAAVLPGVDASGAGTASITIEGTAAKPRLSLRGTIRDATWDGRAVGDVDLQAESADGRVELALGMAAAPGGEAHVDAVVDWDVSSGASRLADAPLRAKVRIDGAELGIARAFLPSLRQLAGKLDARGTIEGTLADPRLEGTAAIRGGRIAHEAIGELRDVELDLEALPGRLILRRLAARSTGPMVITGEATRGAAGDGPWALSLQVAADRFGVVSNDVVRAWLDARASVRGTFTPRLLEADVEVEQGTIRLPDRPGRSIQSMDPHPDFHLVGQSTDGDVVVASAGAGAFQVRLHVITKKPVALQGTDLSLAVAADLRVFRDAEGLRLAGGIETSQGTLLVMGRRFDLQRGRVSYVGTEALDAPRLEITAVQESPHAQVTVTIGGTAQKPTADLRSNPPMSEAEIATLLATGRPQLQRGAGGVSEASGAATALGAVVTSQLRRGIAAKLPVDVISVQAGEEGLETGSLEAGSYVTDRVYVGYSRNFGVLETDRRNANEVRVEYQLHRQWTLEVTYGDRGAGDAGVFWKREFR